MKKARQFALVALVALVWFPAEAYAQGEITGVVRDTSSAVLPGVTVEAASPALIEKVRSVVTDATGQYRIVDLRPGLYTVTFTLPGFQTFRREGAQLSGAFVARIDAEMRVGAIEETVTVTGEAPIVDVQSTTRQAVLSTDFIDALPTSRNYSSLSRLLPGAVATTGAATTDVGGTQLAGTGGAVSMHGSRPVDQRVTLNGVVTMTLVAGGHLGGQTLDVGSAQEITIDQSALSAELPSGGLRINFIPKDGGNRFSNATFFNASHENLAGNNFTQRLKDARMGTPDAVKKNWDLSWAFGGPLKRDKLWFWYSGRVNKVENYAAQFANKNAYDPTNFLFDPDPSQPQVNKGEAYNNSLRLTWQPTPRNKFAGTYKYDWWCNCTVGINATTAHESAADARFPRLTQEHLEWSSPVTNRLLLEAVGMHLFERWGGMHLQDSIKDNSIAQQALPLLIGVQDQGKGNLSYHGNTGPNGYNNTLVPNYFYRAALSYVTGAHALKAGFNNVHGFIDTTSYAFQPVFYTFNNGVPTAVNLRAIPRRAVSNQDMDLGLYVQDRWTRNRLTVNGAVRYDHFKTSFPDQRVGPAPLVPARDVFFPAADNLNWQDITYRSGVAYDLFGNGKTAVKASVNKYLLGQTLNGLGQSPNPVNRLVNNTSRRWNDSFFPVGDPRRGNFVPDCNLLDNAANGECAVQPNANFGTNVLTGANFDRDLLTGFGNRQYNWEITASVQHEIMPRLSMEVAYFRRIWGNFPVTDNVALSKDDFDLFSVVAPNHPELPGGGGGTVTGLYNVKPGQFTTPPQNLNTLSDKIGKMTEHWNGVDITINARLPNRGQFQGGISTGKTSENDCDIVNRAPEASVAIDALSRFTLPGNVVRPLQFCSRETPFLTNVKFFGSYTVPRVDVQVSSTFQSVPGPEIQAHFIVTNAAALPSLGRNLASPTGNITADVLGPSTQYGERLNQLDLRFGKIFRFGGRRAVVNLDLYNALNADTVRSINNNFSAWTATAIRPTSIITARFAKLGVEFDF